MYPYPVKNNSLIALSGGLNAGRCGWICRRLKDIKSIAGEIPIIGNFINAYVETALQAVSAIDDVLGVGAMEKKGIISTDYEPTPAEEIVLDAFFAKFKVFYASTASQLSAAFANNDFNVQLQQINDVLLKICIVKQHFATKEVKGLSPDAVAVRLQFIQDIVSPLEKLIENSLAIYETKIDSQNYSYVLNNSNMSPFSAVVIALQAVGTYSCMRYVDTGIKNNAPGATTSPTVTLPGTTTPTASTASEKSSKLTVLNIGLGIGILWAVVELFKSDKKKK